MDNEFEKQQPENPEQTPSENSYQQYNYQQTEPNRQYDYGNTGYHADYTQNNNEMDTRPLTMGEWVLTLLALLIPCCVGEILYIIWAFSKKGNVNRRNFCRAALIMILVVVVIYIIVMSVLGGAMYSIMQQSPELFQ